MPRKNCPPSYRLHKARNCAVVTIHGKDHYLGPFGSPESHEAYGRLITHWRATRSAPACDLTSATSNGQLTVNAVILPYLTFASGYYVKHGQPTGELDNIRAALASLKRLFGRTAAQDFGPKQLELVRNAMMDDDLCRRTVNSRVSRIKRMFRWASKEGLVPAVTYHGLLAVDGLKHGRSRARETQRVKPVSDADVQKTLLHLNRHVGAMVQIQELTGMRPQEIRYVRTGDIDMTASVWIYCPWTHKTEHHGHVRRIAIGPKAQKILRPFLRPDEPTAFAFSPQDAVECVRLERAAKRKTKRPPSQLMRRPKAKPKRKPALLYAKCSYRRAIARACELAGVPTWKPNQLRHSCGTKIRRLYGLDGAAAVLGHRLGTVTEIYAEADLQKAIDIMRAIG
jgi:integrase